MKVKRLRKLLLLKYSLKVLKIGIKTEQKEKHADNFLRFMVFRRFKSLISRLKAKKKLESLLISKVIQNHQIYLVIMPIL